MISVLDETVAEGQCIWGLWLAKGGQSTSEARSAWKRSTQHTYHILTQSRKSNLILANPGDKGVSQNTLIILEAICVLSSCQLADFMMPAECRIQVELVCNPSKSSRVAKMVVKLLAQIDSTAAVSSRVGRALCVACKASEPTAAVTGMLHRGIALYMMHDNVGDRHWAESCSCLICGKGNKLGKTGTYNGA